jgi:HPt (histidine-containing phosphotransfer) domain-containing protein
MDQEQIQKDLAELWKKYLPDIGERVGVLERACALLREGRFSEEERKPALGAAHKLAGAMGTFGHTHGTELAREVESMLENGNITPKQIDEMKSRIEELRAMIRS